MIKQAQEILTLIDNLPMTERQAIYDEIQELKEFEEWKNWYKKQPQESEFKNWEDVKKII